MSLPGIETSGMENIPAKSAAQSTMKSIAIFHEESVVLAAVKIVKRIFIEYIFMTLLHV